MGQHISQLLKIEIILFSIILLASIAFAETNTTHIIGLEDKTSAGIVAQYGTITHEFTLINAVAAQLTQEAALQLEQEPGVRYVEENIEQTLEEPAIQSTPEYTQLHGDGPTGPVYPWNLDTAGINAVEAWNQFGKQGDGIKIALIGGGVDYTLADLNEQYLGGYDFGEDDPDPFPVTQWTTNKAGIILGKGNQVQGIAPNAQYYALKIWTDGGTTDAFKKTAAMEWAILNNADIVLMDWWVTGGSTGVWEQLNSGYAQGILFVSRAGDASNQHYPAYYEKTISVGGHQEDQTLLSTTQPHYVDIVAPGKDILVLSPGGSTSLYSSTSVAAAHAVGALALMYDYNKTNSSGYSNSDLWKTLNYSAVWLDGQDPDKQGFGKVDINAALTWIEQGWHVSYTIDYLNPDAMDGDTPVYYLGNDIEYQLNIINNSDKDFESLDVNSFHINLEGEYAFDRIVQAPEDYSIITSLLANTSQAVGPYIWTTPLETEPGNKGTEIKVQIGAITQPKLGPGPIVTMVENSFVLEPAPPGVILHLTQMPSYLKEMAHYSGAAVAEMILDYVRSDVNASDNNVTQDQIYDYAIAYKEAGNNGTQDFDAKAMDAILGKYDPYDFIVTAPYDSYDSRYDGNPHQGYNYTIDTYDNGLDYMKDIIHWMSWQVTQTAWFLHNEDYVEHPKTPAALPLYGSYDKWVAVNGYAVSADPTPDPYSPWIVKDFNIYGFWLTDPAQDGIGQHVYVTATEAQTTYFLPLDSNDSYDGKFLQVAEPPEMPSEEMMTMSISSIEANGHEIHGTQEAKPAKVEVVQPKPSPENLEIIQQTLE